MVAAAALRRTRTPTHLRQGGRARRLVSAAAPAAVPRCTRAPLDGARAACVAALTGCALVAPLTRAVQLLSVPAWPLASVHGCRPRSPTSGGRRLQTEMRAAAWSRSRSSTALTRSSWSATSERTSACARNGARHERRAPTRALVWMALSCTSSPPRVHVLTPPAARIAGAGCESHGGSPRYATRAVYGRPLRVDAPTLANSVEGEDLMPQE